MTGDQRCVIVADGCVIAYTVSLAQFMGCYSEDVTCSADNIDCRVVGYIESGIADAKHELVQCSAACRLKDKLFFAKTVSM